MLKKLLDERVVRKAFGYSFDHLRFHNTASKPIDMVPIVAGISEIIDAEGAIISYGLAMVLNNVFSQGRAGSHDFYRNLFKKSRDRYYGQYGISRLSFGPALQRAFSLPPTCTYRFKAGYGLSPFSCSNVLYKEKEKMEQFLRRHFRQENTIGKDTYFIPLFTLEGML